jgi:hypothetical protein
MQSDPIVMPIEVFAVASNAALPAAPPSASPAAPPAAPALDSKGNIHSTAALEEEGEDAEEEDELSYWDEAGKHLPTIELYYSCRVTPSQC